METSQFIIRDPRTREDLADATCGLCHKIAIDPTQCRKGHLFCSTCIIAHLHTSGTCPDGHSLSNDDLTPCRVAQRLVSRLIIRCPNASPPIIAAVRRRLRHPPGCRWTGAVRDLPTHARLCPFRSALCSLCNTQVPVLAMDTHTRVCRDGRQCEMCGIAVTDLSAHYQECEKVAVYCPNHCHMQGEVCLLRRCEVDAHVEVCPRQHTKCNFWEVGCHFEGERAAVDMHVKESLSEHLILMGKGLTRVRDVEERLRRIEERLDTPA